MKILKKLAINLSRLTVITLICISYSCTWFSMSDRFEGQINTAERWLIDLDHKKYKECYNSTSEEYRSVKTEKTFFMSCKKNYKTYGLVKSRTLILSKIKTDKKGNSYTLIKFKTFFTNNNAYETIYISLNKNRKYDIAKYYITTF